MVQNVPRDLDGLPKLIKSVFNPEPNHYGSYYVVEQKEDANNIAYTGADIGLHQDLPYYEKTMGVSNSRQLTVSEKKYNLKGSWGKNQI